jgi:GGDEF domain-containing protein
MEEKLGHMSPVDLDTHLPTLILLDDRIDQAILRTLREARGNIENLQSFIMVMAVRIEGLTQIEEQFGVEGKHYIQDVLISRFKSSIRTVDSLAKDPDGYFYFLFEGIKEKANVKLIIDRLKNCLTVPILYKEKSIKFSINIGTSLYPEDGTSAVALIKTAKVNLMATLKN